jgi:glycosyltransferase involved in cell wall biosynthesis
MAGIGSDTVDEREGLRVSAKFKRRPAIVVIASSSDLGSVARTLIEADQHDYYRFVAVFDSTDPVITALSREMGVTVLELGASGVAEARSVGERMTRALGFPGVLYHEPTHGSVDFSRCKKAAEAAEAFGTYAPTRAEGEAESEESEQTIMAAIPAYNEAATIGDVITALEDRVDQVVVVDDGSSDDTIKVAESAGATVVRHEQNRGYGAALQTTFAEAYRRGVDALVTIDADGQHDPADVTKLLRTRDDEDADIVIGSRFRSDEKQHVPLYRRVGLLIINVLTNLIMNVPAGRPWISDTQSGLRAYDRTVIRSLATTDTIGDGMNASVDVLFHAKERGYDIEEVGTSIRYDQDGTSTEHPFIHGASLIGSILKTVERERPLTFIGVPGVVSIGLGIGFGYWTVFNYVNQNAFSLGIALTCVLFLFLGLLMLLVSVVLHSLKTHFRTFGTATDG